MEDEGFFLQIGAYPETIKDTMTSGRGVPDLYLLPESLFDTRAGISAADLEFPLYFNFYLKGRKLRFLCRRHQLRPVLRVLREAVFGPRLVDFEYEQEFPQGAETPGIPDLRREMTWYKQDPRLPGGQMRLAHMLKPLVFDQQGRVEVDGVTVTLVGYDRYRFQRNGEVCEVDFVPVGEAPPAAPQADRIPPHWKPPVFGITVIGSGHGFDAATSTVGFILWLDGKGILVDPPVNTTAWLRQNGLNTRLIENIILTHCHADHDSGTLQKILEEGRMKVHTTRTIMGSFVTKYCALTGLSPADFRRLFTFEPVTVGEPVPIEGAEFRFQYRLHSIPTIGFEVHFQGRSFVYSSDTLYDPEKIRQLRAEGVLSSARMEELLAFPWHHDIIFHEAGLPPIHTPMSVLADLPQQVKERLYLVHVSEGSIPENQGLKLARPGLAHTLRLEVPRPETSLAHQMLDVLVHIDLFRDMKVDKALEFLRLAHHRGYEPGEVVIRRGTPGSRFFMILSGEAEVVQDGVTLKVLSRYDYLGEMALVLNQPRSADVVARTRLEVLYMERHEFLHFIRGTGLVAVLRRVAQNRVQGAWGLLDEHRILRDLTPFQKNQLLAIMKSEQLRQGALLFEAGAPVEHYFLVSQGQVRLRLAGGRSVLARRGALLGELSRQAGPLRHRFSAEAASDVSVYRIAAADLQGFFRANPGTLVRLCGAGRV